MKLKNCSLYLHALLIGIFVIWKPLSRWPMLAAPALHFLILYFDSSCYQGHCRIDNVKDLMMCEICGLVKWIRMRHCNRCERCVHKYDHHCVLMGICVGEFNHKYYLLFLYVALANAIVLIRASWGRILPEVVIDEGGVEHVSFLYCLLALGLTILTFKLMLLLYLCVYHTFYAMTAQTTWEFFKRSSITYLSRISTDRRYPFSRGVMSNLAHFWSADPTRPTVWTIS